MLAPVADAYSPSTGDGSTIAKSHFGARHIESVSDGDGDGGNDVHDDTDTDDAAAHGWCPCTCVDAAGLVCGSGGGGGGGGGGVLSVVSLLFVLAVVRVVAFVWVLPRAAASVPSRRRVGHRCEPMLIEENVRWASIRRNAREVSSSARYITSHEDGCWRIASRSCRRTTRLKLCIVNRVMKIPAGESA